MGILPIRHELEARATALHVAGVFGAGRGVSSKDRGSNKFPTSDDRLHRACSVVNGILHYPGTFRRPRPRRACSVERVICHYAECFQSSAPPSKLGGGG